jgi:hypothetical protein
MKKQIFLFLALIFAFHTWAQQASFAAKLDTNRILIGEQTTLHLSAKNLVGVTNLNWPIWPDSIAGLELISSRRDTVETDGTFSITEHFVLTSFDSGFVVIPPFEILLADQKLATEPQILNVGTIEILADQDFYDIKAPVDPPFDFLYWLKKLWYVAVILAILLGIGLWFFLRKRKGKMAIQAPPDLRTPAQRARENLAAIRDARVWQAGDVKEYYSQVSDTARTYLEEQFNVPAMEMISDELLDAMQSRISANAQHVLRKMLRDADMVKFAKSKPGPEQYGQLWDDAMQIIELTEPKTADHVE